MNLKVLLLFGFFFKSIESESRYQIEDHGLEELGRMNIQKDKITLSGFSSGGSFAQILLVAYPSMFQGVGVFSHTFLRCGPPSGYFRDFDRMCTRTQNTTEAEWYNPELVHRDIQDYHANRLIEDPKLLKNKKLYVYTGMRSTVFSLSQALNVHKVFERYIQNPYRIQTRVQDSPFVMPTDSYGPTCMQANRNSSYIGNCGFSGAYEALSFLLDDYVEIHHPKSLGRTTYLQPLRYFNQKPYMVGLENHQMDDVGFFYIPAGCLDPTQQCLFHVFFHGCFVGRKKVGETFILSSGYLEVAEANNIIMLFPQNNPIPRPGAPNSGCWDTFGMGGELYATQEGEQVEAVKRMLQVILGGGFHYASGRK